MRYCQQPAIPGYGARIWIQADINRKHEISFMDHICVWGKYDKTAWRHPQGDDGRYEDPLARLFSWEFDDEGLKNALKILKEEGHTEDLTSEMFSEYRWHF